MSFNCENCGDRLGDGVTERGMRYVACSSCGTLHNLEWMRCRADGKAYVQPPVRLPEGTLISRDGDGIQLVVLNRDWESRNGLGCAIGLLAFGLLAGMALLLVYDITSLAILTGVAFGGSMLVAPAAIIQSIGAMKRRTEIFANPFGLHVLTVSSMFKKSSRKLAWKQIRYVDPHTTNVQNKDGYGVKLRLTSGDDIVLQPWVTSMEQALFIAYHLQYQQSQDRPNAQPAPDTIWKKRKATLRRTLADFAPQAPTASARTGEISCAQCGAPMDKRQISAQYEAAICSHCGVIKDLRGRVPEYHGESRLDYPPPYKFGQVKRGFRLVKAAEVSENAERNKDIQTLSGKLVFTCIPIGMLMVIAAKKSAVPWAWALVPISVGIGAIVGFAWHFQARNASKAEVLLVGPAGVILKELRQDWRSRAKVPRSHIRRIFAQADVSGATSSAHVVFELTGGDSVVSFDLPSPWHAQQLVRDSAAELKLANP